jgi:hypothetical protein
MVVPHFYDTMRSVKNLVLVGFGNIEIVSRLSGFLL